MNNLFSQIFGFEIVSWGSRGRRRYFSILEYFLGFPIYRREKIYIVIYPPPPLPSPYTHLFNRIKCQRTRIE